MAAAGAVLLAGQLPASAVNVDHGATIVSPDPSYFTPHAMNGSVNALVQVGNTIIAAGTFTSVSPSRTFNDTSDDLVRNRIFAFDATTGEIDPAFDPNLGGAANSLDTDGTSIYVGGSFSSVSGDVSVKRLVKLTAAGQIDRTFQAVPNAVVNEVVVRGDRLFVGGGFAKVRKGTLNTARTALAALDAGTGTVLSDVNVSFTGLFNGGGTSIKRFDVTPDGATLVAVGNFTAVGGQPREQIVLLNTPPGAAATVSSWATSRYTKAASDCSDDFDSYMRDLDIAPDGSYFVVSTTGAFAGGVATGTLCDTTSRWETGRTGSGQQPTWVSYTGSDTTYGVAITGGVVYVGGHMRWQNNSFQADEAGPGAVPREGIAALDPLNGLPLSWNPGRSRGVGAQALLATPAGLWVGSDTTWFAKRRRGRIAFLPLAGGTVIPAVAPATLPATFFGAPSSQCTGGQVLYRVNVGGGAISDASQGPSWTADTGFNTGTVDAYPVNPPVDATVPDCVSRAIFTTERWDPPTTPELAYALPVTAGRRVTVRLYFADRCDCTATVGSRVFSVAIDGVTVIPRLDINATAGHGRGTMREFTVTSDGTVNIGFGHITENPLLNGIEIVDAAAGGPVIPAASLQRRTVNGAGVPTGAATVANTALDWSALRGAFLVNGTLYYGLADGSLAKRTFDAVTGEAGAQSLVDLYDDPETGERMSFPLATVSGMFFDPATHRLYYTVSGDSRLYYRYFTPESEIVGADTFQAATGGVNLSSVAGMTLAGGKVFYGSRTDGALRSVAFSAGGLTGAVTVVGNDGSWGYQALFTAGS